MSGGGSRGTARRAGVFLACAALSAVAAGCGDTAILLELTGNLTIPADVNALRISVTVAGGGVGQVYSTEQIVLGPMDAMPFMIAVEPGASPLGPVTVNVNAFKVEPGEIEGVVVASGSAASAFESGRVNSAVVMLARPACVDDDLEHLDDGFYGAAVNVGADGEQPNLELCPDDPVDRFNFVVPEGHQLRISIDRFIAGEGLGALQAIVRCTGWGDPTPKTLALGPVAYGDLLLVDPVSSLRTCILDLGRPEGAPRGRVSYGFVAGLFEGGLIPTCMDDMYDNDTTGTWDEPIGLTVPAPDLPPASGPTAMLCPGDEDLYALSAPASRLVAIDYVSLDAEVPATGVSGRIDCDPGYARNPTSAFPMAGRTMPGANGTTTACDLSLLNAELFQRPYRVDAWTATFAECLPDLATPNDSVANAFDLNAAGMLDDAGGRIDGLVVCGAANDNFTFDYFGMAPFLFVTVDAPYYTDGDVDVCVVPLGVVGTTGPIPIGSSCSNGTTDQENVSVLGLPGMRYSIVVDCWGLNCGNVYGLEIGVGF